METGNPFSLEIGFAPLTDAERRARLVAYAKTLTGVADDFWEDHVLLTDGYALLLDGRDAGFFTLHEGMRITSFFLEPAYARQAEAVFARALEAFEVKEAYAPTCDQPFLTLCMDHQKKVELQAYFFALGQAPVRAAEWDASLLRQAVPADEADILDSEGVAENIQKGKYYVLRQEGRFLGQGFFNPMELVPGTACIGMSTHPDCRRQGVGRSIILHLTQLCRARGLTPICGCWYYNRASHDTLISAGFTPVTRLLRVHF